MVARGKSLPKIIEIENKMVEIKALLKQKRPALSEDEIEELVVFLLNKTLPYHLKNVSAQTINDAVHRQRCSLKQNRQILDPEMFQNI